MLKSRLGGGLTLLASLLFAVSAFAQDYSMVMGSGSGSMGDAVTLTVTFDNNTGALDVGGWSIGVCNDLGTVLVAADTDVVPGTDALAATGTGVLGFHAVQVFPEGWTVGGVVDLLQMFFLPAATGLELEQVTYQLTGNSGTSTALSWCDTLGGPPVINNITVGIDTIIPAYTDGQLSILSSNFLIIGNVVATPPVPGQGAAILVPVLLTNTVPVDAVQVGLTYDDSLVLPTSQGLGSAAAGAEFFSSQPGLSGELAMGIVMEFDPNNGMVTPPIGTGTDQPIIDMFWEIAPTAVPPAIAQLTLTDGVGNPPIDNIIVSGGTVNGGISETPNLESGSIEIVDFNAFLRGDCNDDATINIADGVYFLNFQFQGGTAPVCDDACDSNDSGTLEVTDAIYIFNYQFLDGPAPLAPFPAIGIDPTTGDGLGCNGDADD